MIESVVEGLLLSFTLLVGGCFAIWPSKVMERFDTWRGGPSGSAAKEKGLHIREHAALHALRLMGILLLSLTCYQVYLWIRTG